MKLKKSNILLVALLLSFTIVRSQDTTEGLPDDLNTTKVIFLKYEQIEGDPNIPYAQRKRNKERNALSLQANKELKLRAYDYPFDYKISDRSTYYNLVEEGYKYVLENDMMNAYNYGEVVSAGGGRIFASSMYLKDLKTGKRFELFVIKQDMVYDYDKIMKLFIKMVEKEYEL